MDDMEMRKIQFAIKIWPDQETVRESVWLVTDKGLDLAIMPCISFSPNSPERQRKILP